PCSGWCWPSSICRWSATVFSRWCSASTSGRGPRGAAQTNRRIIGRTDEPPLGRRSPAVHEDAFDLVTGDEHFRARLTHEDHRLALAQLHRCHGCAEGPVAMEGAQRLAIRKGHQHRSAVAEIAILPGTGGAREDQRVIEVTRPDRKPGVGAVAAALDDVPRTRWMPNVELLCFQPHLIVRHLPGVLEIEIEAVGSRWYEEVVAGELEHLET